MDRLKLTEIFQTIPTSKLYELLLLSGMPSVEPKAITVAIAIIHKAISPEALIKSLQVLGLNLPADRVRRMILDGRSVASTDTLTAIDIRILTFGLRLATAESLSQLLQAFDIHCEGTDPARIALTLINAAISKQDIIHMLDILHQVKAVDYLKSGGCLDLPEDETSSTDLPKDPPTQEDPRGILKVRNILEAFGVTVDAQKYLLDEGLDIYTIDGLNDATLSAAGVPSIRRRALMTQLQAIKKQVVL